MTSLYDAPSSNIKLRSSTRKIKSITTPTTPTPRKFSMEEFKDKKEVLRAEQLMRTSLITFVAMALHNLPEGLGVYLSSLNSPKMGIQLAVAIMLHNIPEGMAVAIPLYVATSSTPKVLYWTFINGLAEPIGVLLGGALLVQKSSY